MTNASIAGVLAGCLTVLLVARGRGQDPGEPGGPAITMQAPLWQVAGVKPGVTPSLKDLVRLGGRWYFDPRNGPRTPPPRFDHTNADRLVSLAGRLETPFANNMSAWLRTGDLERGSTRQNPTLVRADRFVADSVVVSFADRHLVVRSKNLPNHPTAVFPDRWRMLDGNPNYIQEQDFSFFIPLEPRENPRHVAMDAENRNQALPGEPIGVMANGVIFHNPFDERVNEDAIWRLDRCCGHPSPIQRYHYHKYPVCMNTPWDDQGEEHSPLLGFAFDGFPLSGPYEGKGILAKDSRVNPLNEFNVHHDEERGWHYHVTPGRFPHLIGGFWGESGVRWNPEIESARARGSHANAMSASPHLAGQTAGCRLADPPTGGPHIFPNRNLFPCHCSAAVPAFRCIR